jgi:hypothetical protein
MTVNAFDSGTRQHAFDAEVVAPPRVGDLMQLTVDRSSGPRRFEVMRVLWLLDKDQLMLAVREMGSAPGSFPGV